FRRVLGIDYEDIFSIFLRTSLICLNRICEDRLMYMGETKLDKHTIDHENPGNIPQAYSVADPRLLSVTIIVGYIPSILYPTNTRSKNRR
ncbi:hypothetical protein ACJX0J_023683, partial [Zea mays]